MVVFVRDINNPHLETRKIARIDSFSAIQKAITFAKLEPSLVSDLSAEIKRKYQLNFNREQITIFYSP